MRVPIKFYLLLFSLLFALQSCGTSNYYQIWRIEGQPNIRTDSAELVYEDQYCRITYNLWTVKGSLGYDFYNKTDKMIILDKRECFYVSNNVAHNYYRNRTWEKTVERSNAKTETKGSWLSLSSTQGNSVRTGASYSVKESEIEIIPPFSKKQIREYEISGSVFTSTKLEPDPDEVASVVFNPKTTPLTISNVVSYSLADSESKHVVTNTFYVKEISNVSIPSEVSISPKPNSFYIEYNLNPE